MVPDWLTSFLASGDWRARFDGGSTAAGAALARARLVKDVAAETMEETGDVEIRATVLEKGGGEHSPAVIFWQEGASAQVEGDCRCGAGTHCAHAAAVCEYFSKATAERLTKAFGGVSDKAEDKMVGVSLELPPATEPPVEERAPEPATTGPARFIFRVERRPPGERSAWLPGIFATATAAYGEHRYPLEPSGIFPAVPDGAPARDRAAETEALRSLYALDFLPGAEEPPAALRKLDPPPVDGTLWKVDAQKWPSADYFWQRFRHEGTPALERRGWEVQFAPDVGMPEPLKFKTEGWRAEIVDEGKGWFHLSAGFDIDGESFELQPILAALVKNDFLEMTKHLPSGQEFLIFLPDGRGLALPVGRFRKILTTLGELLEFPFAGGKVRINALEAALVAKALAEGEGGAGDEEELEGDIGEVIPVEVPDGLAELAERLADFESIDRPPPPEGLDATLREYQDEGFAWMQFLARYGLHGILADDMGLGKTLQALAHILAEKESGRDGGRPSLVVAPTSVVVNWQREAAKFAPDLRVLVLQGAGRKHDFRHIPDHDIVLTSFALIHRDLEKLSAYRYHVFALDEAQHIKNRGAQVSDAVRGIDADHRLCLSGTPVENHLGELWSLMDFLMPGLLGKWDDFVRVYKNPIEKSGSEVQREALVKRVGRLILRRTKNDVAKELPPKTEILHTIELDGPQQDLYETVRSTMDKRVRQALAVRGTEAQIVFLDALLKLRQICCHPQLLKGNEEEQRSAKFDYLVELLADLRENGHRILLFSQFTSMLSILEAHLDEVDCPYLKLTGETKDRQDLVERWQGGEGEVFLISLKAGGTGLTLTGADIVIHYDPWWNPAAENQATDRAYRIGQDKPVFVHKLICQDTVEEKIQQMQIKKGGLATDVLAGAIGGLTLNAESMAELLGSE